MLLSYKLGQSSIVLRVKVRDATTGQGLTGLTSSSTGLRIATIADNEATTTAYTASGSTIESITTLGTYAAPTATKCRFKEVDATNHPGLYELQIADARFAVTSAKSVIVSISGVSGMAECDPLIPLLSVNPYDGMRFGMAALPNYVAAAANGVMTAGTAANQIQCVNGKVLLQPTQTGVTIPTVTTLTNLPAIPTDWLTADGVKADAVDKIQAGLATPTNITAGTITTVTNLTNAPTAGDFTSTMKASITTAATDATPTAAAVTADVNINMAQAVPTDASNQTAGKALNASIVAVHGAKSIDLDAETETYKNQDNTTAQVHDLTVTDGVVTARTPA